MAYLLEQALRVVNDVSFKYEDRIEAFQFLSDNWELDKLTQSQQWELNNLVEKGLVITAPWRKE